VLKRDASEQPLLIRTTVFSAVERRGYERELVLARDREREVAHVLQRSLLASEPLRESRIRIGAYYRSAVETLEVGGDWHDAFPAGEGRVGVVVGDVVGRGIEAASAMGQLRSATRALAGAELGGPAQLLARLDRFAARLPLALMATLVYAEIELDGGAVRYACAGHPPPLLMQPDAEPVVLWEGRSLPLGVAPDGARPADGRLTLAPGGRLLLYTDGLVERHEEPLDRGFERLAAALRRHRPLDPQALVDELVETLRQDDAPRDDVCALCLELGVGGAP
jgi:serine phosphatase RsbU (regulator of sigma subunit)